MSVITRREISKRLKLNASNPKGIVITPLSKGAFSEESVDLRLGTRFLLPQVPPPPYVDLNKKASPPNHLSVHVPRGKYLVLPAHETILGATLEFIKLPYDLSGMILTKSSVARAFVVIETAPWIHPFYRGCLTLEIANVSNTPVLLYPGEPIGQLILLRVRRPLKPKKLTGSFIGPVYPEMRARPKRK
jgi:dCTP deaminase